MLAQHLLPLQQVTALAHQGLVQHFDSGPVLLLALFLAANRSNSLACPIFSLIFVQGLLFQGQFFFLV